MEPCEISNEQRRIFINTAQLHEAYMDAFTKELAFRGGMHWKKSKNKEYLFRTIDRHGNGKSIGPRSPKTETIYQEFHTKKKRLRDNLLNLKEKLKGQARLTKAVKLARVPQLVTAILRLLEQRQLMGRNLKVIGTNALFAYEAKAGVFFESDLTATQDMDILWDIRSRLRLWSFDNVDPAGLIGILRKADRSFAMIGEKNFRAVNRSGYMVDLVKPEPKSIRVKESRQMGDAEDLMAVEIRNLHWLVSSPPFSQPVIGEDGFPANMIVPDPRAFALHKLWLSEQYDREPIKKNRDRAQALAVYKLVVQYFPNLPFAPQELKMFPKQIVTEAKSLFDKEALPPGYGE